MTDFLAALAAALCSIVGGAWLHDKGHHEWHLDEPLPPSQPQRTLTPRQRQRLSAYRIDPILRSQIKENA